MKFLTSLSEKIRAFSPSVKIYPLIIIVAVPLLLIISTVWNLNSFNRDVNFIIRHEAVSLTDTIKPLIATSLEKNEDVSSVLRLMVDQNKDLISVSILEKDGDTFRVKSASGNSLNVEDFSQDSLNRFAESLKQSFAGLVYDPKLAENVWVVAVPLEINSPKPLVFSVKLSTKSVDEILSRTSRDSFIILVVLIIITLALLANHFFFYKKALHAQQLEEIDRMKDEFFSMASHELRTPITAVVGYIDLLKDKIPQDILPTIKADFDTLDSLMEDLGGLIEDLLEVSRIEQRRFKIVLEKTLVNDLILDVVNKLKPLAGAKSIVINYTSTDLPATESDTHRISQVLTNLINNAIKYSLEGHIDITAGVKDNFIEVKVKDTGIGIPAEELPKLFTKFHRVKDEKTQDIRGTGLGLWITKQIVETLGGKINVESIYGSGSNFIFTIPLRSVSTATPNSTIPATR